MDSLTTAYLVCMLIGSGCAIGGAMAGNKAFPIGSSEIVSSVVTSPPAVESELPDALPQNTAQTVPEVSSTTP